MRLSHMRLSHSLVEWVVGAWALVATLIGVALLQRYLVRPGPAGDDVPPAATTPAAPLQSRPALPC
jgi:hypothetical protein